VKIVVIAASPNSGANTITGEGLAEAMAGTQVVVDPANSPMTARSCRWLRRSQARA
jgi:hypothetical protein